MNYSQQRDCILNIVMSDPIHPTVEQVYEAARKKYPRISLGTVYRNLNQLSEIGVLKKICSPYGSTRFDGRTDPHFHMECTCCGKVYDVELSDVPAFEDKLGEHYGFAVTRCEVSIQGICGDCRKKH
ncbi:MAG: transcriptional repressor [Eubacterium sp.]|nr:transcriptional repressor [Eubacterium sp.]